MSGVKGRSGRHKATVNTHNGRAALDALQPRATFIIDHALEHSTITCPHCKKSVDIPGDLPTARWVTEMNMGKPRQQVGLDPGPATIKVIYEGESKEEDNTESPEIKEVGEGNADRSREEGSGKAEEAEATEDVTPGHA